MFNKSSGKPQFKLKEFEGPLDLLLQLVKKNKLSIFDISTSNITEQYLQYLGKLEKHNLACSSEFLAVASQLIKIKSAGLLPKPVSESSLNETPTEDDEAELIKRLREYEQIKLCAKIIENLSAADVMGFFKPPETPNFKESDVLCKFTQEDLIFSYEKLLGRLELVKQQKVTITQKVKSVVKVSVFSKIKDILKILKKDSIKFYEYFSRMNCREEKVSAFLAVLELVKQNRIRLESPVSDDFSGRNVFITKI